MKSQSWENRMVILSVSLWRIESTKYNEACSSFLWENRTTRRKVRFLNADKSLAI
jgi:hypothetical protein